MTQPQRAAELAAEVLRLSRATLLAELRFLEPALCRLELRPDPQVPLATDGRVLLYGDGYVLRSWKADKAAVLRGYLHAVLHCIYHHPFVEDTVAAPLWDLACDIAAEDAIDSLGLDCVGCGRDAAAGETLARLRTALNGRLTAERIYHYYRNKPISGPALEGLRAPFLRDDHSLWYERTQKPGEEDPAAGEQNKSAAGKAGGERAAGDSEERPGGGSDPRTGDPRGQGAPHPAEGESRARADAQLKAEWGQVSAMVQTDLETHSRRWGDRAGSLLLDLRAANRRRTDYAAFLRRFAQPTEVLKVDDEAFDTIFYTYGLRLYGNMPLVEPLEYAEAERIRDFVVVVDTSASVQGEKVRRFLQCTCDVLLEPDTYADRSQVHILECDAAVQRDTCLHSREELETFLDGLQFRGGGGTDFRPAFAHVEELYRKGGLPFLRGMLYFTDGDGEYPAAPPALPGCKTAFVFADEQDAAGKVPPWAIRVWMDPDGFDLPRLTVVE